MSDQRYAVIDVGSNSVKLLIAERDGSTLKPVTEISTVTRLGEKIGGALLPEMAMRRTLDTLDEYANICLGLSVAGLAAVGTSALRDAANRDEFVARAAELRIPLEVISGEEEARLSYLAVSLDAHWREAPGLFVTDIGGGSTEVILGDREGVRQRVSYQLGAVRLTEAYLRSNPPAVWQIEAASRAADEVVAGMPLPAAEIAAVGVGGTIVNLAAVKVHASEKELETLHGVELDRASVEEQIKLYASCTLEERKLIAGLNPARADVILGGALIVSALLRRTGRESIAVSTRGLRWGLLYERYG